jgi:hypothetical protein
MYQEFPNVKVIGLGHKARNGKDTTAAVFQDYFGSSCRRYAFADPLRAICRVVYGMTDKDAPLLQIVGTEIFRQGKTRARTSDGREVMHPRGLDAAPDPDVWVRTTFSTIGEQQPLVAVISDVRFPNEAEMVKQMGGTLIKCVRRTQDGRQYIDPSRDESHPSETALDTYDNWDYEIEASSVKDLEYQAVLICEQVATEIGYYAAI